MTLKESLKTNLYMALTHYPVTNRNGETIASAVTNLDLHDMARAAKTYGIGIFFVVTPFADQKSLIEKIISHWKTGAGARYNPTRSEALKLIVVHDTIEDVAEDIRRRHQRRPKIVVTCARNNRRSIGYDTFRCMLDRNQTYLLVFGTAWGLTTGFIDDADFILDPIQGRTAYNHLSVRSAASIVLDRLLGRSFERENVTTKNIDNIRLNMMALSVSKI